MLIKLRYQSTTLLSQQYCGPLKKAVSGIVSEVLSITASNGFNLYPVC